MLRDVAEEVLLKALKLGEAQGSATVAFVLENLPRRLSERYVEELAALTDVTRKEGEAAQIEITKAIQAQAKAGPIRFIEKDAGARLSRAWAAHGLAAAFAASLSGRRTAPPRGRGRWTLRSNTRPSCCCSRWSRSRSSGCCCRSSARCSGR